MNRENRICGRGTQAALRRPRVRPPAIRPGSDSCLPQEGRFSGFGKAAHSLLKVIANSPYAVIACVQGVAFGGGMELALGCDLILASKNAKFSLPELNLGLIPGFGGTQRLIQRTGVGFTKRAILTSEHITSEFAYNRGIVDFLVEEKDFDSEIDKLAKLFTAKSLTSIEAAKKSINKFYCENLENGLKFELEQFSHCFNSPDGAEGLKAFIEKRTPEFK